MESNRGQEGRVEVRSAGAMTDRSVAAVALALSQQLSDARRDGVQLALGPRQVLVADVLGCAAVQHAFDE